MAPHARRLESANYPASLDALVPKPAAGEDELPLRLGRVSRADVARLALVEGLKVLERRYVK